MSEPWCQCAGPDDCRYAKTGRAFHVCRGDAADADGKPIDPKKVAAYRKRFENSAHRYRSASTACIHRQQLIGRLSPEVTGCSCPTGMPVWSCELARCGCVVRPDGWNATPGDLLATPAMFMDGPDAAVRVRACLSCPDRDFPLPTDPPRKFTRWAVGVTTAPRRTPRVAQTLGYLEQAGWSREEVTVFAEPDSENLPGWNVLAAEHRLGAWRNWLRAIETLLERHPDADVIAVVQDDVHSATGLRAALESLSIPGDAGLVSPYCPSIYRADQDGLFPVQPSPSGQRAGFGLVGACFLVFPRLVAAAIVRDPFVREYGIDRWIDGVVGHVLHRLRLRPYFHQPSLVQHIGDTSTVHGSATATGHRSASSFVEDLRPEQILPRPIRPTPRLGVIGYATASGLGRLNWQACTNLPVMRWLAPKHQRFPVVEKHPDVDTWYCLSASNQEKLEAFLCGLDAVLFFELPYWGTLQATARRMNVRTIGVAMHECMPAGCKGWPQDTDLIIYPNRECERQLRPALCNGKYVPWPIDINEITYRQRTTADTFFFGQGTGGGRDRKGGNVVIEAAKLTPQVPWIVRTQITDPRMRIFEVKYDYPDNVRVLGQTEQPNDLYRDGDIAVQPSRYEGLGLQLLEAQAAGMPLITTDAAPMNEYAPLAVIPASQRRITVLRPTTCHDPDASALARLVEQWQGRDITAESAAARAWVERERSWQARESLVMEAIQDTIAERRDRRGCS